MIGGSNSEFRLIATSEEEASPWGRVSRDLGHSCNVSFLKQGVSCMGVLCIIIYIGGLKENFKSHLGCKNFFFPPVELKALLILIKEAMFP